MSEKAAATVKTSEQKGKNPAAKKSNLSQFESISHPSPIEQVLSLQRTVGNHAVTGLFSRGALQGKPIIQREFDFILRIPITYGIEFRNIGYYIDSVRKDIAGLRKGDPLQRKWIIHQSENWISRVQARRKLIKKRNPNEELSLDERKKYRSWYKEYRRIYRRVKDYNEAPKRAQALDELSKARKACEAHREKLKELEPKIAEAKRAAFKRGDDQTLAKVVSLTAAMTDTTLAVDSFSSEIRDVISKVNMRQTVQRPFVKVFTRINKSIQAVNIILAGIEAAKTHTTELQKAKAKTTSFISIFSGVLTFTNTFPAISVYINTYVAPFTNLIFTQINQLAPMIHGINSDKIKAGIYPSGLENYVGKYTMFNYMVQVMHPEPEQYPKPNDDVQNKFLEKRKAINLATGSKMPVEGIIFYDLKFPDFHEWMWKYKKELWQLFYGSLSIPTEEVVREWKGRKKLK